MVNVSLIGRATVRYTLGYGGIAALSVLAAFRSPLSMALVFLTGLVALLYAFSAETRSQSLNSSARMRATMAMTGHDPEMAAAAAQQPGNFKALFVGVGLLIFGATGAIIAAGF